MPVSNRSGPREIRAWAGGGGLSLGFTNLFLGLLHENVFG